MLGELTGAAILHTAFVIVEHRSLEPMLPPRCFAFPHPPEPQLPGTGGRGFECRTRWVTNPRPCIPESRVNGPASANTRMPTDEKRTVRGTHPRPRCDPCSQSVGI